MPVWNARLPGSVRSVAFDNNRIEVLRLLKDFFGITFQLDAEPDGSVMCTCRGVGFKNLAKRTT